jgi:polyhydroxyalkanoate synthase
VAAPLAAFNDRSLVRLVRRRSQGAGVITARQMGAAFTWMRPRRPGVRLRGQQLRARRSAPAFDILAWNADGTNLPAALHARFLDIFRDNSLVEPGALTPLHPAPGCYVMAGPAS